MQQSELVSELQALRVRQRRLTAYCAGVTLLALAGLLMGAAASDNAEFDVIDVERINVREPDGTLRLTISNRTRFPGAFIKNEEVEHPRPMAGMLFLNDEGTEAGGLIFNGMLREEGGPSSGLSLTFDRYQQDQQLQLLGVDEGGRHFAGLTVSDVADGLERPIFSEEDQRLKEQRIGAITRRLFVGKDPASNAMLQLLDGDGKARLELQVAASGEAQIVFLDETGHPTRTISAAD